MSLLLALALALAPPAPVQDLGALVAEIAEKRDEVDPAAFHQLAALGTRESALALVEAYEVMSSPLARREVLFALGRLDGIPEAEQPALQKVTDVAVGAQAPELSRAAIDVLAAAPSLGHEFLRVIVESPARDAVRIDAMRRLVEAAAPEDGPWFRRVFDAPRQADDKDVRRAVKKGEKVARVDTLTRVRELAFERVALDLDARELAGFAREKERDAMDVRKDAIRRTALLELERRADRKLGKLAREVFEDRTETGTNRALAARMVAADRGAKAFGPFVKEGMKDPSITPRQLRLALAELARELRSQRDEGKLVKELAKARPHELAFLLRVLRGSANEKAVELAQEVVMGESADVAVAAAEFLAATGLPEVEPALETAAFGAENSTVAIAALRGLGALRAGDPSWMEELVRFAASSRRQVRNAALEELARLDAAGNLEVFVQALESEDWTTRVRALAGLEGAASREAVAAVVARMPAEEGRMAERFGEALWRLSGQPFGTSASSWTAWWKDAGPSFERIDPARLAELEVEEERRRLAQVSRADSFFGLRVLARRIVFVLDVSGSMEDPVGTEFLGEDGVSRMDRAKEELVRFIDGVEAGTLYNLILFSRGAEAWLKEGIGDSSEASRAAAREFVGRITPGGGTNLYGGLALAFSDPDVEAVIVLSDGEPSVGRVTDSWEIRNAVQRWNEGRGVVIHTVAVGGSFPILEWLAEDSGGSFTQFR